jgi:hypothetical protein
MQSVMDDYRNLTCCSADGCNLPDPSLDTTTEVVAVAPPPDYSTQSCYQSASNLLLLVQAYTASGPPRMVFENIQGTHAGPNALRNEPMVCANVTSTHATVGAA